MAGLQVHLMAMLTVGIKHVWLCTDLRDRLAVALGYFLDQVCSSMLLFVL